MKISIKECIYTANSSDETDIDISIFCSRCGCVLKINDYTIGGALQGKIYIIPCNCCKSK
jgi:hypothetical protein